ncbi:hypothetical protein ACH4OV_25410 [Streptomyces diastaticus]|jgi:hypothetical protein|uniref:hypothetical protein n=1 Tax=Streptomyces TaxID=1883 RepID=UPI0002831124|nr:hypothetical protein [Streptomyces sp. SM8]
MSVADPYGMKTRAVAFAVRAGHTDEMAHRFLERLCATGQLALAARFPAVLRELMEESK